MSTTLVETKEFNFLSNSIKADVRTRFDSLSEEKKRFFIIDFATRIIRATVKSEDIDTKGFISFVEEMHLEARNNGYESMLLEDIFKEIEDVRNEK